jgi:diketogulonate reductase-like aldo/keto reductase
VLIAWSVAVGVPVHPRTSSASHMEENLVAWQVRISQITVLRAA